MFFYIRCSSEVYNPSPHIFWLSDIYHVSLQLSLVQRRKFSKIYLQLLHLARAFSGDTYSQQLLASDAKQRMGFIQGTKKKLQKSRMHGQCTKLIHGILSKSKNKSNYTYDYWNGPPFAKLSVFMNDVDHCKVHIYIFDRIKLFDHLIITISQAFLIVFKLPLIGSCIWTFSLIFQKKYHERFVLAFLQKPSSGIYVVVYQYEQIFKYPLCKYR